MEDRYVIILTIIIVTILLIFTSAWWASLDRNYKNTPLVNFSNPTEKNLQPKKMLLEENQVAVNQNSSGWNNQTLQQPCLTKTEKNGLPNLPNSYILQECSTGQVCVNNLTKGDICLSTPGYPCFTKLDCDPSTSDECLNDVCVSKTSKLNNICQDNKDCFTETDDTNNLSCVEIATEDGFISDKRCRYDLYPLGNRCDDALECFPDDDDQEYDCVQGPKEDYIITGKGGSERNIILDEGMSIFVYSFVDIIDGKKIKIEDTSTGISSRYKITNFDIENYSFTPVYYVNNYSNMSIDENKSYNIIFYEGNSSQNVCVAKINIGAKISSIENDKLRKLALDNENICKSGSTKIEVNGEFYCEMEELASINDLKALKLCDNNNNEMGCPIIEEDENLQLRCTYDEKITETTENNYNFIGNNNFKSVGRCLFPSGLLGTTGCGNNFVGCKPPNLCYSKDNASICLQPLETQKCYFDDTCAEGFICVDNQCLPSGEDTPITVGDSLKKYGLFYFDTNLNAYKKIKINGLHEIDKYEFNLSNTKLILGQTYNENNIEKICLFDEEQGFGNTKFIHVLTYQSITKNYLYHKLDILIGDSENRPVLKSIVLDADNNILLVLKRKINTVKERSYKISNIDGNNILLDTKYHNLSPGTQVFYIGTSTSEINQQNIYTIDSVTESGISINITPTGDIINGYIITYDNKIRYTDGSFDTNFGIGYCENTSGVEYSWVQTGDMFKVNQGDLGVSGSLLKFSTGVDSTVHMGPSIFLNQNDLYFYTEINRSEVNDEKYSYYMISDDYNASEGGCPFINNKKYVEQEITASNNFEASLYKDLVTYSVIPVSKNNGLVEIPSNLTAYIAKNQGYISKNGMPAGGITYAFDETIDIEFKAFKKNDKNYLLLRSQVEVETMERGENLELNQDEKIFVKNVDYVQRLNYSIGTCWDTNYDYQFRESSDYDWFNFTYENNSLLPHSKNFFDINNLDEPGEFSFNKVDNLYPNLFIVEEPGDLNIYNSQIENDTNQTESKINIISESNFKKIESDFQQGQNPVENLRFKNLDQLFKIPPVSLKGNLVPESKSAEDQNTFTPNTSKIIFNNSEDIDMILKFGSSEIAIVKESNINEDFKNMKVEKNYPTIATLKEKIPSWYSEEYSGSAPTKLVSTGVNVILVITQILSHTLELDSEQLICQINRPVTYPINESESKDGMDSIKGSFDKYIIDDPKTDWNLYLYNYIPLEFKYFSRIPVNEFRGVEPLVNIFDSSPLYTSAKNNKFYTDKTDTLYSRCSYNKILFSNSDTGYKIINNFDGLGVQYETIDPTGPGTYTGPEVKNFDNYEINQFFSVPFTVTINQTELVNYFEVSNIGKTVPPGTNIMMPKEGSGTTNYNNLSYFYPSSGFSCFQYLILKVRNLFGGNGFFGIPNNNIIKFPIKFKLNPSLVNPIAIYENLVNQKIFDTKPDGEPMELNNYSLVLGSINTGTIANIFQSNNVSTDTKMYTINNLFMSSLSHIKNLQNQDLVYNNKRLLESFIISNSASSDGKKKRKGSINFNLDSMSIVAQKPGEEIITSLDTVNIDAINWPSWIELINNNNILQSHKIEKVFYNSGDNNDYSKATYYVYTSYINNLGIEKYQMYYFSVEEKETLQKGVTTGKNTDFYKNHNIEMDPLTKRLYLFANRY